MSKYDLDLGRGRNLGRGAMEVKGLTLIHACAK